MTRKNDIHILRLMLGIALGTLTFGEVDEDREVTIDRVLFGFADGRKPKGRVTIVEAKPRKARMRIIAASACSRGLELGADVTVYDGS